MNINRLYFIAALSPILTLAAVGQTPPPTPPPPSADVSAPQPPPPAEQMQIGSPATHNSRVSAIVYGPRGEVQALILRSGVTVSLNPELGMRLQASVTKGTRVQVSGMERVIAGQTSLVAQSVTANGQTFATSAPLPDRGPAFAGGTPPLPPAPPAGPPSPRALHAGRRPGPPPPPSGPVSSPAPATDTPQPPPPQM